MQQQQRTGYVFHRTLVSEFFLPYESVSSAKIVFSFYSYTVFLRASLLPYSAL